MTPKREVELFDRISGCCGAESPSIWTRLRRFSFEDWFYRLISDHTVGGDAVPLSWSSKHFIGNRSGDLEYVLAFLDDSFSVGIGYPTSWNCILDRKIFHKMIIWYLWKWSFSEWFGLRRWVWYKLLHRRVKITQALAELEGKIEEVKDEHRNK